MKKKNYVYKITKKGQKNQDVFENYDFWLCESVKDDEDIERIFAKSITINKDNPIYLKERKIMQHCYDVASKKDREKDFVGFPEKVESELCSVHLCFASKGFASYTLFINSSIAYEYYNTNVIDKCCKEVIEQLLQAKLIRKALAPKDDK